MPTNFDLWNGVAFAPSASISELADSLAPAVRGALSDMRAGADSVLSLAGKVPNNIPDAAELAGMADSLRDKFTGMMAGQVQALCVHPWQQGIGERAGDYAWLTPEKALAALGERCAASSGMLDGNAAVVLLFSCPDLASFSESLRSFSQVFPLPDVEQAARRAKSLMTLELDKFVIPTAPVYPGWFPSTPGTSGKGAGTTKTAGALLAQIESVKAAALSPLEVLKQAGERMQARLDGVLQQVKDLQDTIQGTGASWFGSYLTGTLDEIGRDLRLVTPPASPANKVTAALIWFGPAPQLDFFKEVFLPMMFLRLDDYTVPGFGLRVSGAFQLKKADASGETSSTTKADKGTKGKTLTVTTQIRYQDEADLLELIRISEAKGSGESGKVYTITNTTANAAGIRQVIFADRVSWDEQEGRRCWNVSFTLAEHKSVPERAEARKADKPLTAASSSPAAGEGAIAPAEQAEKEMGWIYKLLKKANDAIGDYE